MLQGHCVIATIYCSTACGTSRYILALIRIGGEERRIIDERGLA